MHNGYLNHGLEPGGKDLSFSSAGTLVEGIVPVADLQRSNAPGGSALASPALVSVAPVSGHSDYLSHPNLSQEMQVQFFLSRQSDLYFPVVFLLGLSCTSVPWESIVVWLDSLRLHLWGIRIPARTAFLDFPLVLGTSNYNRKAVTALAFFLFLYRRLAPKTPAFCFTSWRVRS